MAKFETLRGEWAKHRARLERETRVLVIDEVADERLAFDRVLYRRHIPARVVEGAEGFIDLIGRERYSLLVVAHSMLESGERSLVRQLRAAHSEVEVVVSAAEPTLDLLNLAFDQRLLDVVPKPTAAPDEVGERVKSAVSRSVDRRMRELALRRLREDLAQLDPDVRARATTMLERRLAGFKRWIGAYDGVLVVEAEDVHLRSLGENLLVGGLRVEVAETLDDIWQRLAEGAVHLVILGRSFAEGELRELLDALRIVDPLVELVLLASSPVADHALGALRLGVPLYLPWPGGDPAALVLRVRGALNAARRDRLMESLLTGLVWETQSAVDPGFSAESFEEFRRLVGMTRVLPAALGGGSGPPGQELRYLDQVLDLILEEPPSAEASVTMAPPTEVGSHERRAHLRVPESQFVRFRRLEAPTGLLACVGDISEGGLFVRTADLLPRGTRLDMDVNMEHDGQGYVVRCHAEVAWTAEDNQRVPYGPGFGVRFVDPPEDVMALLRRLIKSRVRGA